MDLTQRPRHPLLENIDKRIEAWRSDLISSIRLPPEFAAYALIMAACSLIENHPVRSQSETLEIPRALLFSLQFSLESLMKNKIRATFARINSDLVLERIDSDHIKISINVIREMVNYYYARDAFLGFYYRVFDLSEEHSNESNLVFIDPPEWPGNRDHAQRQISIETDRRTNRLSEYPTNLDLRGISSDDFLKLWFKLSDLEDSSPCPIIFTNTGLTEYLSNLALDVSYEKIVRFTQLVSFSPEDHLSLFHCPIVQLTTADWVIVHPALKRARLDTIVKRLAIFRGLGLNSVSNYLSRVMYERIRTHYGGAVIFGFEKRFPGGGDIDIVAYEPNRNCLTLAEVKCFINPDSVVEVMRANRDIVTAVDQIGNTKQWYENASLSERRTILSLPNLSESCKVNYAILGNGFVGSDFVEFPRHCLVADLRYLLRPCFAGRSFKSALESYTRELERQIIRVSSTMDSREIVLAGVRINLPTYRP